MTIDDIIADFDLLDDWEDRYRYVIELGKGLAPYPDDKRNEAHRVQGCASQVWLTSRVEDRNGKNVLRFEGDSDALIVRGLVAIALAIFDGRTPEEALAIDAEAIFGKLQLSENLTAQRANGLRAMIARIRGDAETARQRG